MHKHFVLALAAVTSLLSYTLTDNDVYVSNGVLHSFNNRVQKEIVIPEILDGQTITVIGENAFERMELTSVELPSTVTRIDSGAFSSNGITSLSIPASVDSIGPYAFSLNVLKELTIPATVNYLGEGAFSSSYVASLTIEAGELSAISPSCFYMNNLTSLTLPSTVTRIEEKAFDYNDLESVTIPEGCTYIGANAFARNALTSIAIPGTVDTIDENAFSRNALTEIDLGYGVSVVRTYAFSYNSIETITLPLSLIEWDTHIFWDNPITKIELPIVSIEGREFVEWVELSTYYKGGDSVDLGNNHYFALFVETLADSELTMSGDTLTAVKIEKSHLYKHIVVPDSASGTAIRAIGPGGLNNGTTDNHYRTVQLPEKIHTIGKGACSGYGLISVALPDSLRTLGEDAFFGADLTEITLPDSLVTIGAGAFYGSNLTEIKLPETVLEIGGGAFGGNEIDSFVLHTPVRGTDEFVEWRRKSGSYLVPLEPEDTVVSGTAVSQELLAFFVDTLTTKMAHIDSTGRLREYFQSERRAHIVIPDTLDGIAVTKIEEFANSSSDRGLATVELPAGLLRIADHAFDGNELESITIPDGVKYIGDRAFYDNRLTEVVFGTATQIDTLHISAFFSNHADFVLTLPESNKEGDTFLGWAYSGSFSNDDTIIPAGTEITYFHTSWPHVALWKNGDTPIVKPKRTIPGIAIENTVVDRNSGDAVVICSGSNRGELTVSVYDQLGTLLFTSTESVDGDAKIEWDLTNRAGRVVASGSYMIYLSLKTVQGELLTAKEMVGVKE